MWARFKGACTTIVALIRAKAQRMLRRLQSACISITEYTSLNFPAPAHMLIYSLFKLSGFIMDVIWTSIELAYLLVIVFPFVVIPYIAVSAFETSKRVIGNLLFKLYSKLFPKAAKVYTQARETKRGVELINKFINLNKNSDQDINFKPDDLRIFIRAAAKLNIKNLNLSGCHIGDAGIIQLKELLENNNNLETLDLSDNLITDIGMENLFASLKNATKLETLILSSNKISDVGAKSIATFLRNNSKLEVLKVGNNLIGDAGALDIINTVKECPNIKIFCLAPNAVTLTSKQECLSSLANNKFTNLSLRAETITAEISNAVILNNDTLVNLKIEGNLDRLDQEQPHLGSFIGKNPKLESLSLFNINIGDGMQQLTNDLSSNKTLTTLTLFGSYMNRENTQKLAKVLTKNTTLKKLDLSWCRISKENVSYLTKAIKNNYTLEDLGLGCNDFEYGESFLDKKSYLDLLLTVEENNLVRKKLYTPFKSWILFKNWNLLEKEKIPYLPKEITTLIQNYLETSRKLTLKI